MLQSLDSQYKFAKEFNSEVMLRHRLWKSGYKATQEHLPGLQDIEVESLKVQLSILFKQFFKAEQTNEDNDQAKPLLDQCSKVLKDYVLIHRELVSIQSNRKAKPEVHARPGTGNLSEDQLQAFRESELEKQLEHQSPIVHGVILENLLKLEDSKLFVQVREMC